MPQARGMTTVTQEELEELQAYGNADIMLLNNTNNQTNSGEQSASGTIVVNWTVTWNENGFTGYEWNFDPSWSWLTSDLETLYNGGGDVVGWFNNPENEYNVTNLINALRTNGYIIKNQCIEYN